MSRSDRLGLARLVEDPANKSCEHCERIAIAFWYNLEVLRSRVPSHPQAKGPNPCHDQQAP